MKFIIYGELDAMNFTPHLVVVTHKRDETPFVLFITDDSVQRERTFCLDLVCGSLFLVWIHSGGRQAKVELYVRSQSKWNLLWRQI